MDHQPNSRDEKCRSAGEPAQEVIVCSENWWALPPLLQLIVAVEEEQRQGSAPCTQWQRIDDERRRRAALVRKQSLREKEERETRRKAELREKEERAVRLKAEQEAREQRRTAEEAKRIERKKVEEKRDQRRRKQHSVDSLALIAAIPKLDQSAVDSVLCEIWREVLEVDLGDVFYVIDKCLYPAVARRIVQLCRDCDLREHMEELCKKADENKLSHDEEVAYRKLLLQDRAHRMLAESA